MNNLEKNSKDGTYVQSMETNANDKKKSGTQKLEDFKGVLSAQHILNCNRIIKMEPGHNQNPHNHMKAQKTPTHNQQT
jgi:hypothetical protein